MYVNYRTATPSLVKHAQFAKFKFACSRCHFSDMSEYRIEVCANSPESCVQARDGGAYRVELCAGIPEGGTTPSAGAIWKARQVKDLKLHVIIRPRAGDFLYSQEEIEVMLHDIKVSKQLGADGVVFGCLDKDGNVDMAAMKRLMEASKGMSVTFHRAFDVCRDPMAALEQIIELGCERILTSGQKPTAEKGAEMIAKLVEAAKGRIIIMPGCGVNEKNVVALAKATGAKEFHMSLRNPVESEMVYRNPEVSMGGTVCINEYARDVTNAARIRVVFNSLKELQ